MASFFLFGGMIVLVTQTARLLTRETTFPSMAVYLLIGIAFNALNIPLGFIDEGLQHGIHILAELGIVILLFRVGLESNLATLLRQLKKASLIWLGDVGLSAVLGFVVARSVLGFPLLASLFVATALSATSVGLVAIVWQNANRLETEEGALLIDIAELDDISAIVLMALLFSLAPALASGKPITLSLLGPPLIYLLIKLAAFLTFCVLFSLYVEARITNLFRDSLTNMFAAVVGITFLISGLASWMGFSLAVGAIFSGFAFSRDPSGMELDHELESLFQLFVPFFFVNIGLGLQLTLIPNALLPGLILFAAAVFGKLIGTSLPALFVTNKQAALLLGVSMIPRAEIAMIVMLNGIQTKSLSAEVFGAMVVVSLLTSLLIPPLLSMLFAKGQHQT